MRFGTLQPDDEERKLKQPPMTDSGVATGGTYCKKKTHHL
jgi:hypothetical protein